MHGNKNSAVQDKKVTHIQPTKSELVSFGRLLCKLLLESVQTIGVPGAFCGLARAFGAQAASTRRSGLVKLILKEEN